MSYQRVEGVVSAAGANAIDEQAGLGIALPRGKEWIRGDDVCRREFYFESYFNLILSPPSDGGRSTASATGVHVAGSGIFREKFGAFCE
jgi:hypothetical protein